MANDSQAPEILNPLVVKAIKSPKSLTEAEIVSLAAMVIARPQQAVPKPASKAH